MGRKKIFSSEVYGNLASDDHSLGHFAYLEGQVLHVPFLSILN